MFRSTTLSDRLSRPGHWCSGIALMVCLGLAGCCSFGRSDLDFSGMQGFNPQPPPHWTEQLRRQDSQTLPHAVTNKGMQIERSLGVGAR